MAAMLEGKIAAVTGAGGGIGREIAIAMASAGAKVIMLFEAARVGRHVDRLELDPTYRQVFLHPEAARSMRVPEHLDRFAHLHLALPRRL